MQRLFDQQKEDEAYAADQQRPRVAVVGLNCSRLDCISELVHQAGTEQNAGGSLGRGGEGEARLTYQDAEAGEHRAGVEILVWRGKNIYEIHSLTILPRLKNALFILYAYRGTSTDISAAVKSTEPANHSIKREESEEKIADTNEGACWCGGCGVTPCGSVR